SARYSRMHHEFLRQHRQHFNALRQAAEPICLGLERPVCRFGVQSRIDRCNHRSALLFIVSTARRRVHSKPCPANRFSQASWASSSSTSPVYSDPSSRPIVMVLSKAPSCKLTVELV